MQLLSSVSNLVLSRDLPGISPRVSLSCLGESLYPSACPASALSGADTAAPCPACPAPVRPSRCYLGGWGDGGRTPACSFSPQHQYFWVHWDCRWAWGGSWQWPLGGHRGWDEGRGLSPFREPVALSGQTQAKHKCCASFSAALCRAASWGHNSDSSLALCWASLPSSSRMGWADPTHRVTGGWHVLRPLPRRDNGNCPENHRAIGDDPPVQRTPFSVLTAS